MSILISNEFITYKYILTYVFVFFNVFFIQWYINNNALDVNIKFVTFVFFVYAIVGIIQFYFPSFLSGFVSRGEAAVFTFSESGRGVRSLSPEPATLGKVFNILFVLSIFLLIKDSLKLDYAKIYTVILIYLFAIGGISRSAYAFAIFLILVFPLLFIINRKLFFIFVIIAMFSLPLIATVNGYFSEVRMFKMFDLLYNEPSMLLQQGAIRRLLNIPISINNLQYFGFFGAGNSPLRYESVLNTPIGQLQYTAFNRNLGGYIELVLKFGILSLPIFFIYLKSLFKIIKNKYYGSEISIGFWLAFSVLTLTIQDGSPTLALSWFLLLYISKFNYSR
ncbi:hypothetical protein [Photobacterium leiognathi]|uniref:hypothetical protein n=1 Tax=Photobacterium leiognathi TaxID=553611 RepID=UPI002736D75D|nr:hypothetical protein [Photobacterium leiognathi]